MNVFEKLSKARAMLQQKPLKKSGKNHFAKFEYFELGDFLPHINSIFAEVGLVSKFILTKRYACLSIINTEQPNEQIKFLMPVAEADIKDVSPIQSLGGQQTYMRRYLWLSAMEIVEHDALDAVVGAENKQLDKSKPKSTSSKPVENTTDKIGPKSYKAELLNMFKSPAEASNWVKEKTGKSKISEQEAKSLILVRQGEIEAEMQGDIPLDDIVGEVFS